MRKNMRFAIAAAILALAVIFWVKSDVDASSADVRSKAVSHTVAPGPYLPFRVLEPMY
jgi:hypothetical protein